MLFEISERLLQEFGEERMIELVCSSSVEQLENFAYE